MGEFDNFVDDDDEVAHHAAPKEPFNVMATGYHALADVLTYCQGKCSPQQLKGLKLLYMKRKERGCTVDGFLREAHDLLGTELFTQAMISIRTDTEKASKARAQLHGQQQTPGADKAEGLERDERVASKTNTNKKVDGDKKGVVNIDVSQEADDVLAIAGVNTDDEAKLLFAKQTERRRSGLSGFQQSKDKDPSRRIIDLRLYTRIAGEGGIASSNGITRVSEQVCDFLEEALQVRLKGFVANVSKCAARRNDANKDAFKKSHSALEPKQKIRSINVNLEREKAERVEKERRHWLRVGQSINSKRKKDFEDDALKEKVAKVQQEEEERQRATVANQAARDALGGDAKYSKWFSMDKTNTTLAAGAKPQSAGGGAADDVKPRESELNKGLAPSKGNTAFDKIRADAAAAGTKSILLRDCVEALHDDEHGSRLISIYVASASRRAGD